MSNESESTFRVPKIINVANAKKYALMVSQTQRGGHFTRVSKDFLDAIEADLKIVIRDRIHRHPSKGVTLMK